MSEQTTTIISKVWGMCNPLRDDGVSYGDYLEQLTYLIFLKMSDEYSKPPYKRNTGIPTGYAWSDMNMLKGAELEDQYKATLEKLGEQGGILGQEVQRTAEQSCAGQHQFVLPVVGKKFLMGKYPYTRISYEKTVEKYLIGR